MNATTRIETLSLRTAVPRNGRRPPAEIRLAQRYAAAPQLVFRAWLDPAVAGRWLFATATEPLTAVEIDARVGGAFRLAEAPNGGAHTGEYLEIVPHERLVFTLAMAECPRPLTRVTVEIVARKPGCELALTHRNVPPNRVRDTEARWAGLLYGLAETLAGSRSRRTR